MWTPADGRDSMTLNEMDLDNDTGNCNNNESTGSVDDTDNVDRPGLF